ncbi:NADP-dependent 3-hydroxy acid dehydrogenase YdfG [Bosea lupini]|uniref:NADP-dependent 3-hydroxy acid dehydrogenase YdfG n=1 Tax=Bosea lupini TaxID=1036779 RepID=A0A1H7ZTB7_9HYPH|nr:SDR family NAD(P)-dependent oxidoreductase [Bosea lupini]SEM60788.1 NADP-dependent 3-hydroxy acid dehydrogenase YdfG [Bosea lupini]
MSKTILIVGAGPGIGLATAKRFAREDFRVVLAARNADKLKGMSDALSGQGAEVVEEIVDLRDAAAVDALVSRYAPDIDVLHYNAGVLRYSEGQLRTDPLGDLAVDTIEDDVAVNVTGALAVLRAALPAFYNRGSGSILLTGGGLATTPHPDLLTLSVGKAGIRAMAQGLFEVSRGHGVHVGVVTVAKLVSPASAEADEVADLFWGLHAQPKAEWAWEELYS